MDTDNNDIYNGIPKTEQCIYDNYNNFIFSNDTRVFNKFENDKNTTRTSKAVR
jgi:hypothetical protein